MSETRKPHPAPGGPAKHELVGAWVHAHEEDGEEGEVYRREGAELPLSRRPRERLEIRADGTAILSIAGPDDRSRAGVAAWREVPGALVVTLDTPFKGARELRVRKRDAHCIVMRREGA